MDRSWQKRRPLRSTITASWRLWEAWSSHVTLHSAAWGFDWMLHFSRALATSAPAVLMDDQMRGVDVGTKKEVYSIIRDEAEKGRTFIWYSTEMEEVSLCDRVYVFNEGVIVRELIGGDVTEENIL